MASHDPDTREEASSPGQSSTQLKAKWKTLRDFVDERAIEEALERMEEDRIALDVGVMSKSLAYLYAVS